MLKIVALYICFAFAWLVLPAQHTNFFNHFKVDHWDTKNGLSNDVILNTFQSKDGFIWLSSYAGLTRFDGVNFTAFNSKTVALMKTDNVENFIIETDDSTLWIPTSSSGLLAYKKGKFSAYLKEYGLYGVLAKISGEKFLLATNSKKQPMVLFDTKTGKQLPVNDSLTRRYSPTTKIFFANTTDSAGNQWRWVNTKLVRVNKGIMYELGVKEGILPGVVYTRIYVDKQWRVWLTSDKGLLQWNGHAMEYFPGMEGKDFNLSFFTSFSMQDDKNGGLWAATVTGLAYLAPHAQQFIFIPESRILHPQNITNLLEDKEGNLWVSSQTGLYKLSEGKFNNYSTDDGFDNNRISGICVIDSSRCLAASAGKLFWVENGMVSPYVFKNKEVGVNKIRDVIYLYKDSKKNIWVCADAKIIKISPDGEKLITTDGRISFAYEDAEKRMWFAVAGKGIAFFNEKDKLEIFPMPQVDFSFQLLSTIRKTRNGNWLVTAYDKGIMLIDKQGKPTQLTTTVTSGQTSQTGVFASFEDNDGSLWFATQAGLARYKDGKFAVIGLSDGLPENSLFDLLPDQLGYVWFPSNRGLIRAKKQELTDYFDKKTNKINWQLYDDGDGMYNRQCVGARHGTVTPDGRLMIPTFGGLVEINPASLIPNPMPPPVVIHRVLQDNKSIDLSQENIFDPGNHRYVFEYSALSLVAPQKVKIKFRLIGSDKDWISSVGDRKAFYTNLPSGKYTFQVIAANNDGTWNETGASFVFTIKPFFYETIWFRLLAALALLLLIWLIVKWRTRAVQKQNDILEAQVASRTRDLNKVNNELNESNAAIVTQRDSLEKTLIELKSTQSQLIQSEKMASLGELTAGIAHEIQNPLNFVNNFSEVNKELLVEMKDEMNKGNLDDANAIANDVIANEEKINHHGKRADAIVKGMLQHSRNSSGQKESTDINKLADEYFRLAYHGLRAKDKSFNATLRTAYDEGIGNINIIPQDIGRIILNLITNAFYAVGEKKKVQPDYEPIVTISTMGTLSFGEGRGEVKISVTDNGGGIPKKILDKIFQPFFTTKPTGQGTGLGLSLAYDIVKAHGGEINVESKDGEGTTFIIQLPVK